MTTSGGGPAPEHEEQRDQATAPMRSALAGARRSTGPPARCSRPRARRCCRIQSNPDVTAPRVRTAVTDGPVKNAPIGDDQARPPAACAALP